MGIKIWWPLSFVATIILACVLIFPSDLRVADLLGKAGRIDEAIQNYHKVLAKEPNRADVRLQLGQLYILNDEPEKALAEFEAASKHLDLDAVQLVQLYQIYSSLRYKEQTIDVLEKLVELVPDDRHYAIKLADAYEWNNNREMAIALYDELLTQDPEDLRFLNKLVSLNLAEKNYPSCIEYLNRVLKIQPRNKDARMLLGNIYIETNQKALAAREFERTLRLVPKNEALRVKLAELYLWMQDYENGILHYEHLLMEHVLKDAYFDKLVAITKDFDPDRAVKHFNYRLKYLPRQKELREHFVELNQHLGRTDEAITQLNILIENYPHELAYKMQLAQLYQDVQKPTLAVNTWEAVFATGTLNDDILQELIPYYHTEKEYAKLLKLYSAAITKGLADRDMRQEYAETLARLRHYDKAISEYGTLLRLNPQDTDSRLALANLHILTENTEDAFNTLWQGVQQDSIRDAGYLLEAGQFFTQQQHYSEAIAAYEKLMRFHPYNRFYNSLAANLYIRTKNFKKASLTYQRMLSSEPHDLTLKLQLASLYWLQNDRTKTELLLQEIEAEHVDHPHLDREIGRFHFERGFLSEAIEHLELALISAPTDSASLRMLGLAYAWSNQPKTAKKILQRYHRNYPHDYYTHYHLGELLLAQDDRARAAAEFETAMLLVQNAPQDRDALMVAGKLYAYQNKRDLARKQFETLINQYPPDEGTYADFAEGLLALKEYDEADYWIDEALGEDPDNYRALRLRSRSYFEQGRYKESAQILARLQAKYPNDLGLRIDLADAQQATGDWVNSEKTLEETLRRYPNTWPAEQRLLILRREQNQAFATDYEAEEQSGSYLRQLYNLAVSKASSSLAHLKFRIGEETYTTDDPTLENTEYQNLSLSLSSRISSKLQTSATAKAQRHLDHWNVSATGMVRWHFAPSNTAAVSAAFNELWRDPIVSAFHEGRLTSITSELNLNFFRRVFLWNQLSLQQHKTAAIDDFGNAFRASVLLGYNWFDKPLLSTFYQFYTLRYHYDNPNNSLLISIPERQDTHYLGAALSQQLSRRVFYKIGGNVGVSRDEDSLIYFASFDLEYMLFKQLRLRSHLTYGNLNRLVGNENIRAVKLDLSYFY